MVNFGNISNAAHKITNEDFVNFALHLFAGTTGNIKYTKPGTFGSSEADNLRLKRHWMLRTSWARTPSACNNIVQGLRTETKLAVYTSPLGAIENIQYDNGGVATNANPLGNANLAGAGIKIAIKAVIECFMSSSERRKHSYDNFLTWLSIDGAGGAPGDEEGIDDNGAIAASEWIKKWSAYLIKEHGTVKQQGLQNALNPLVDILGELERDPANDNITVGAIAMGVAPPNFGNITTQLTTFQNEIKQLNPQTRKHYKDVHSKEGNSLYNQLLFDNDAISFTIKTLNAAAQIAPNVDITQVAIDSQYHRAALFKEIKTRIGAVVAGGGGRNFNTVFDTVLDMSQFAMSGLGGRAAPAANVGAARHSLIAVITNGAALSGGGIAGNGAVPGGAVPGMGGGGNFIGANIGGIIAAYGAPPAIAIGGGGQNGLPGGGAPNAANVEEVVKFYLKYKTAAEAKAGGGGGIAGDCAGKYWMGISRTLQAHSWSQLQAPAAGVPNPNHAYSAAFSSVGNVDKLPYDDQMINNLKAGLDTRTNVTGNLQQRSTMSPLQHIQIIADCAAAQVADKIIADGKAYSNNNNVIGNANIGAAWAHANLNTGRQMIVDIDGNANALTASGVNRNVNAMIAIHYGIFLAAAKAIAALPPAQAVSQTSDFGHYTPDDIAPAGGAPAPGIVIPQGAAVPAAQIWTTGIRAALDTANKYVKLFTPS